MTTISTLEDFISAYTPSLEKKVISFVSLRAGKQWISGQYKNLYTLTMRDDIYTNTILDFQEECLMDTVYLFQVWLDCQIDDTYADDDMSVEDVRNEQLGNLEEEFRYA